MEDYKIIVEQEHQTVMAHYEALEREDVGYQSEAELEAAFIKQLVGQGYERVNITSEKDLLMNLRAQMERLNGLALSDKEWKQLLEQHIASPQMTIEDKTERIQRSEIVNITLDNGDTQNIKLIDKRDIHNNHLQVLNQYVPEGGKYANRYDVTILVNGLPLVHCELKRRGVDIKEAFNQINRYERDSFWSGCGLYDYVQIFIISNGTQTKYYSNTTRFAHVAAVSNSPKQRVKTQSQSFEFTSCWSDAENNTIWDLRDFTRTFLAKSTLLNVLTKYCVFTVDKNLMVMRPYQIAATERILLRIKQATMNKWQGSIKAGGYIWHTTGSGKTLTSFKTAQLASMLPYVHKVLFVVDRKDLDYQTMKEYDNFEKGCANSNTSSNILQKQLNDPADTKKIIITTIQKLTSLLKKKKDIGCADKNVVMIFDECHRSQFGDMHVMITKAFKKYYLFGFTGTPISSTNIATGKYANLRTTAQAFGGELDEKGNPTEPLHTYTIIDAIRDKNVLKFKVDYIQTMKMKGDVENKKVWAIETKKALMEPERITNNVRYILEHYAQKTKQRERYTYSIITNVVDVAKNNKAQEEKRKNLLGGFNSILCVESIPMAIAYYTEFQKQQEKRAEKLRIATIFTFSANEAEDDAMGLMDDEDPAGIEGLDVTSRDFLERAIAEYNGWFGTNYSTDSEKFQNYYKDLSLRMKNREVDLLIVVSMFLTGFDAKTLNTLWVDKNLRMHGLLQAYSRTNRILNSIKDCGNIVCFRNLEEATNASLALFGNTGAKGIAIMRPFKDYYEGYDDEKGKHHEGYVEIVAALLAKYNLPLNPQLFTLEEKKEFVRLFSAFLKMQNLLSVFDEFTAEEKIISDFDTQDYLSWYIDLREELRSSGGGGTKDDIVDDLVFETELVKQIQIDIPYILQLIQQYRNKHGEDKTIVVKIQKAVNSSPDLRDKKELIMQFIERMTPTPGEILEENEDIGDEWALYVKEEREKELNALIEEEKLRPEETRRFVEQAFSDGYVTTTGVAITKVLPPLPLFGGGAKGGSSREEKKERVLNKLTAFFNRYFNLSWNPHVEQVHTTQLYQSAEDVYHGKAAEAGGEG
ncbi:MAG: type I restriction endonuclease subunit R [Bacteroidaceae bacterium]|nr:type I restriction endonuclease subunit R [Bacteroidaceae bacterium]